MKARKTLAPYWAVKTDETSLRDGRRVRLHLFWWNSPKVEHGKVLLLFATRVQARAWIKEDRGYIAKRPDLRREPHCWRVGAPVRVTVKVTEQ
jgi:hypothetical protein